MINTSTSFSSSSFSSSSLPPTIASTTTNTESNLNILSDKSPSYNNTSLKLNYTNNLLNNSNNSNNYYNINTMNTINNNNNDSLKFNKNKNFQQSSSSQQQQQQQQKRPSNSSSHLSSANAVKFFKDEIEKELKSNDKFVSKFGKCLIIKIQFYQIIKES
ncbi:unnamed protein product [[Candida] boidinii]|nr:unnamed protein product [[Candida] boidinii]